LYALSRYVHSETAYLFHRPIFSQKKATEKTQSSLCSWQYFIIVKVLFSESFLSALRKAILGAKIQSIRAGSHL
jgi:hypothetical protein